MSGNSNMKFLYVRNLQLRFCFLALAPFLASPDPDGLESAAGGIVEESKMSELEEMETRRELSNARLCD